MKNKEVIHILRNPYGIEIKKFINARLKACDIIEEQEKEINKLKEKLKNCNNIIPDLTTEEDYGTRL